jgi:hypothetical protein
MKRLGPITLAVLLVGLARSAPAQPAPSESPQYPPPAYPVSPYPPSAAPVPYYGVPYPQSNLRYGYPAYQQPPMRTEMRPNYALLFSGIGVWFGGYICDVFMTLAFGHSPAWEAAVPVIGPFLQLADSYSRTWNDLAKASLVTDAIFQVGGFTLAVVGLSVWHKVQVRAARAVNWAMLPSATGGAQFALTF